MSAKLSPSPLPSLTTTQRENLENLLKEQAIQIAKHETALRQREEFLGVCAHDLRSPLGLIQSSLSMVLSIDAERPNLTETQRELLTRAKRQTTQAIQLVNDLLDIVALEQGFKPRYRMFNLNELLQEFYRDYSSQAEQKGVKFHYENPIHDWRVLADSDRMRQLLQNLFVNALKFTESGRNIYLKVSPFHGRRKGDPPYPMLVISLRDEGKGIPQKEIQKIFDRFTQIGDVRNEGRGLGLTVAKQISTLHDGNIWVQSEEGKGSTFFVLFPHVISRPYTKQKPEKIRTILVAVPNMTKRIEYFERLAEWGYEVKFARDGIESITHLFYHEADAVILTAPLAKIDAPVVAELLKSEPSTRTVPILLALEAGERTSVKLDEARFDAVIEAPFPKQEFEAVLKEITSRP